MALQDYGAAFLTQPGWQLLQASPPSSRGDHGGESILTHLSFVVHEVTVQLMCLVIKVR